MSRPIAHGVAVRRGLSHDRWRGQADQPAHRERQRDGRQEEQEALREELQETIAAKPHESSHR